MLNPDLLTHEQTLAIKEAFSSLKDRGIVDFDQDMDDPIRQSFDLAVLRAFKIEEYYSIILDSIKSMRKIRKTVGKKTVITPLTETIEFEFVNNAAAIAAEGDNKH